MSLYLPPFNGDIEPNETNVRTWMENLWAKCMPIEQARWNQSNIDSLFYAGNQSFINRSFSFTPGITAQQYYFNLVQQPTNMITGRQRQHRKQIVYQSVLEHEAETTDQYTKLINNCCNRERIHEGFSKSCELAAVAGLNLIQPYLDYTGDDVLQGSLKIKVWEYNSFIVDPYFREPDMSDANYFWCQEYISKQEALSRFKDKAEIVKPMQGAPQRYGRVYFLPENYNMARNDLYVVSYIWYKWKKKKKRLYSKKTQQFYDFAGGEQQLEILQSQIPDIEAVTVDSVIWKCCTVLNEQLMSNIENPLWDGPECPVIPNYWNYEPWISQYDLRSRSLIFPMRSPQFLFNHKVITNNDIAAATINSGYKRKHGAVANEDNLKKAQNGYDIIINPGFEMTDIEKIIPTAVPESDLALATQMQELIFSVSGINLENWSGQQDKQTSALTLLIKQDANLMVFQKYFDQWDMALKILGERLLQYAIYNWSAEKVASIIGEEPSAHFYSRVFAKYRTVVEEGELTSTQQNLQAQNMLEINERFGREVIPPSMIIPKLNITGKAEIISFLKKQEQQAASMQKEQADLAHAFESAKLEEIYSKVAYNIANARERHGRSESNLGLYEERLSMIEKNRAMTQKEKMSALTALLENVQRFGEIETHHKQNELEADHYSEILDEEKNKLDAESRTEANKFLAEIMGRNRQQQQQPEMAQQQM
jgi:hypothetical protein